MKPEEVGWANESSALCGGDSASGVFPHVLHNVLKGPFRGL